MDDHDLASIFHFHVPKPDTFASITPSYHVPTPAHRHTWRRRKGYLETEKRCYFHWKFRNHWHFCYATYVFIEKRQLWSYAMPRDIVMELKKLPVWCEEEKPVDSFLI